MKKGWTFPSNPLFHMVRPERFELPTPKFVAWCSIQLSYGRVVRRRILRIDLFIVKLLLSKFQTFESA